MIIRSFKPLGFVYTNFCVYTYIFCVIANQCKGITFEPNQVLVQSLTLIPILGLESDALFLANKPFHRIQNDQSQLRQSEQAGNMFDWMNLRNQIKFRLWTR